MSNSRLLISDLIARADLDSHPIARAETIPSRWYVAPEFLAFEEEAIFGATWQCVGRVQQVSKPGDYFLATVAKNPLVIVRDGTDTLRCFYNVCRHRAGPLVTADGHTKAFQCRYHGWTYALDGSLRGVPHFEGAENFDRKNCSLKSVALSVWEGLIFVHLGKSPEPFPTVVDGIVERIAPVSLERMQYCARTTYQVACNWKVYIDNYLEGYHVGMVHPTLGSLLAMDQYDTELFPMYSLQASPLLSGDKASPYDTSKGTGAFYYFIYPNFMLNILPGRLQTNLVLPTGPEQCQVVFDYFYEDGASARLDGLLQGDLAYSDQVQQEDITICEAVQRGLRSKGYDRGRFAPSCEKGVHHFQNLLRRSYRSALDLGH